MAVILTYGADLLMIFASLGAAAYCLVLSRRLSRLSSFDRGLGGAIAVLSTQVDDMKTALQAAKAGSDGAGQQLSALVRQAQEIGSELELMIAACHDFAEQAIGVQDSGTPGAVSDPMDVVPPRAHQGPGQGRVMGMTAIEPERAEEAGPDPVPIFGSRRTSPPEPLFRHRRLAGG